MTTPPSAPSGKEPDRGGTGVHADGATVGTPPSGLESRLFGKLLDRLRAAIAARVEGSRARTRTELDARYARGLAAVSQTPPSARARIVLRTLAVMIGLMILWAIFGKLDIVATAEGKLVPQSFVKIVQPSEAGVMQTLLVREGDRVQAGQVLIRMDTSISGAEMQVLKADLDMRKLQLRRIDAELGNRPFLRETGDSPELHAKVADQYRAYRQALADSLAQEEAGLTRARQDLASATQVRDKLRQSLGFYNKQTDTFQKLGRDGFVSPLFIEDKQREKAEKEQDLKAQEYALASLSASVEQSQRKLAQLTSAYRQQLQTERMQALSQAERLGAEWQKQQHKHGQLELKAPVSGVVKDIASHTAGTVVNPGTILLTVVPVDEPLIAEVQVKNQDIGFITPRQTARVKIAAFPFQKYGMLDGEVLHMGADSTDTASGRTEEINPESRLGVASHYKARIKLSEQRLRRGEGNNEQHTLLPGMQVVAEMKLGERTVLEYLLSPVAKVVKEAGRER